MATETVKARKAHVAIHVKDVAREHRVLSKTFRDRTLQGAHRIREI